MATPASPAAALVPMAMFAAFGDRLDTWTPPAEQAREYMDKGEIGELVYCLHKMGFNGGEPDDYKPSPHADLPYFHLKAFLSHPLSVMRYFCGDVTHVQAFLNRPGFQRRVGDAGRVGDDDRDRLRRGCRVRDGRRVGDGALGGVDP